MGRRVEGEIRSKGHDDKTAVFDGTTIPLRRWEDWERSRLRKLRREEKRRKELERQYGAGFHGDDMLAPGGFAPGRPGWIRSEYESDAGSVFSSEDDVWGADIGGVSLRVIMGVLRLMSSTMRTTLRSPLRLSRCQRQQRSPHREARRWDRMRWTRFSIQGGTTLLQITLPIDRMDTLLPHCISPHTPSRRSRDTRQMGRTRLGLTSRSTPRATAMDRSRGTA